MASRIREGRAPRQPFLETKAMSQKPKDGTVADLTIANSVVNLIQGDIQEPLPMTHIPLAGDVLGLGALAWCTSDRGDR